MIIEPITRLTKEKVPFVWEEGQKVPFDKIKGEVRETMMLVYPDLRKPFDLYPDAGDHQIYSILAQSGKTLGCFSKKTNPAQKNNNMTDELKIFLPSNSLFKFVLKCCKNSAPYAAVS